MRIYKHNQELTKYARLNRKKQTDVEKLFWYHIRGRKLKGLKFRRQFPVQQYIIDFYCEEKRIGIELDGSQHSIHEAHDKQRSHQLEKLGIHIMRFWDHEVLQNIEGILEKIRSELS